MLLIDYIEEISLYENDDVIAPDCAIVTGSGKVYSLVELIRLLVCSHVQEISHSESGLVNELHIKDEDWV